jgi:hypothetical protein
MPSAVPVMSRAPRANSGWRQRGTGAGSEADIAVIVADHVPLGAGYGGSV